MSNVVRGFTIVAWGLLVLTTVTLLCFARLPLCLQFPLIGFSLIALVWLLIRYNRLLAQWRAVGLIWLAYSWTLDKPRRPGNRQSGKRSVACNNKSPLC